MAPQNWLYVFPDKHLLRLDASSYHLDDVCYILDISRQELGKYIKEGVIKTTRAGTRVSRKYLAGWLDELRSSLEME